MAKKLRIYTLVILFDLSQSVAGTEVTLHDTEQRAKWGLYEYVRVWWNEFPDPDRVKLHTLSEDEAVKQYFGSVKGRESYEILELPVNTIEE